MSAPIAPKFRREPPIIASDPNMAFANYHYEVTRRINKKTSIKRPALALSFLLSLKNLIQKKASQDKDIDKELKEFLEKFEVEG